MLCRCVIGYITRAILSSPLRCLRFSASSLTLNPSSNAFDDGVEVGSAVYRHALKFQRPGVIKWCKQLQNTASFIGSVTREPKVVAWKTAKFGVHTWLTVRSSDYSSFGVLLMMWDGMAEFASKNLKSNDFIFVSGSLGCYTSRDSSGNLRLRYKITVKELNFVAQRPCNQGHKVTVKELNFVAQRPCNQGHKVLESTEDIGTDIEDDKNRLHLWQVFFANPHEWWDNRKRKANPKQPDFKHKDTGEALWLNQYDPPWVKRQLQILDSKVVGKLEGPRSRDTTWVYHD